MTNTAFKVKAHALLAMAAAVLTVGLGACSPPPTTSYTNEAGQEVTVNWKDYPVHAYSKPQDFLGNPAKEDAEAISETLLSDIKSALSTEFGLTWTSSGEPGWHQDLGNGYGGKAMTTTYNSVNWDSDTAPASTVDWEKIVAVTSGITAHHGLGPVQLTHNDDTFTNDPAWQQDLIDKYGTADPQTLWWWDGTAHAGSQWLFISLANVDRDATGAAATERAQSQQLPRSVSLMYGITTVPLADQESFQQALKPFLGLTPPEPTTSD